MTIRENYNVNEDVDIYQPLYQNILFTQMNAKKGIKLFGERAILAMFKEYT